MKGSIYLEEMSSSMTLGVELLQVAYEKLAIPFWSGLKKWRWAEGFCSFHWAYMDNKKG